MTSPLVPRSRCGLAKCPAPLVHHFPTGQPAPVTKTGVDRLSRRVGKRISTNMTPADQLAIERLRCLAERHRRMAEIHDAFGETQKAIDCRALAEFQEERARRLERRATPS